MPVGPIEGDVMSAEVRSPYQEMSSVTKYELELNSTACLAIVPWYGNVPHIG